MTDRKRDLGVDAQEVFRGVKKDLLIWLDQAHEESDKIPTADLWSDFAAGLAYWSDTLGIYAERLADTSKRAYRIEDQNSISKN